MKIVVTGHQGFVGHHVGAALIARGHAVTGIDDLRSGGRLAGPGYRASILEEDFTEVPLHDVDAIVHCAAHADVSRNWESIRQRTTLWMNNVDKTLLLMERARNAGIKRVVFISTLAVNGPAISPYAASKIAGEALVRCYAPSWHILRLGTVMGEGYHHGHVADFVRMAKEGGVVRAKSSGIPARSCVHALDVADAVCEEIVKDATSLREMSGGLWSPRDTVRVMGCKAEWAAEDFGWAGDVAPISPHTCARSIGDGVRDALRALGWPVSDETRSSSPASSGS